MGYTTTTTTTTTTISSSDAPAPASGVQGRGLHSSTFQLNLSAFYRIVGARRACVARVKGVLGGV